ncbi:hypothetical protein [Bradyrhizobium sp. Ash2021]|uniref:hypothetical protein n=1 Tax=Bradyrhizobium sp. Ash2021 TaxID=2954771 RepID=UPI002815C57B|nr:hypothetical protein [Bradyrhizobium sp. Ash2021]WMT79485.1 hypothetical protein NL528_46365 [Bradyrhizobium sp. Ash2021]
MLRILLLVFALCVAAHSEESRPRESEHKAEAAQADNHDSHGQQQITVPANSAAPTIINISDGKHAGEESQCAQPKDWKEWPSFAWCKADVWLDAERVIATFTVILGIATLKLWRSTDTLVRGADLNAERQLRAYISFTPQSIVHAYPNYLPRATFIITNTGQTPRLQHSLQRNPRSAAIPSC